jgi:hypothetical protein
MLRFFGHFEGDAQTYRASSEDENNRAHRDCLRLFSVRVTHAGVIGSEELEAIDREVGQLIDEAVASAKAAPLPTPRVIDLRTLSPIDWDTVIESLESTGRLVVVDEANPRCSIATDVAAHAAQHAFGALKAAPHMVTAPHTPVPFSPVLEDLNIPTSDAIAAAASKMMGGAAAR